MKTPRLLTAALIVSIGAAQAVLAEERYHPLQGVNFGPPANLAEVTFPKFSDRFCLLSEKLDVKTAILQEINDATENAVKWLNLRDEVKQRRAEVERGLQSERALYQQVRREKGSEWAFKHRWNVRVHQESLAEIDAALGAMQGHIQASEALVTALRAYLAGLEAVPVVDCQDRRVGHVMIGGHLDALAMAMNNPAGAHQSAGSTVLIGRIGQGGPFDGSESERALRDALGHGGPLAGVKSGPVFDGDVGQHQPFDGAGATQDLASVLPSGGYTPPPQEECPEDHDHSVHGGPSGDFGEGSLLGTIGTKFRR